MKDIFNALIEDHESLRSLMTKVLETSGSSPERERLFDRLKEELEAHAKYEERTLYGPMLKHDETQEEARHSVSEHKEIDDFLEDMKEKDMSSPAWIATAKKLADRLTHHLDEEEEDIFPVAKDIFSKSEQRAQGKKYTQGMEKELS